MSNELEGLINRVKASGGSEIANTQVFIERLCKALGLEPPEFSTSENRFNDYVFERRVDFKHPDGSTTPGRIDLYKRGCFVLESKQSSLAHRPKASADQLRLVAEDAAQVKQGTAKRGTRGWDQAMVAARAQAESYARALPVEHGYPPFLIVLDVGHVIELYADFSGQGKNYAHFPDRQSYRLSMDDLLDKAVQQRLIAIWRDPLSLDPAKRSAEVTRDIAARLAKIARSLEGRHDPRDVAEFLMRCLFTMFAEDVGLLPKQGFADLLKELHGRPETFPMALESLWRTMDEGGYEPRMMQSLRRFNGSLFKNRRALPLAPDDIEELYIAARQDWSDVEPAIFGTLLERALDPRERAKLGAHYTPRAYVERLVVPTIIEPLRADWGAVQAHIVDLRREGRNAEALAEAKAFHHRLCTIRVLDPACGTGNFLYVALELMKKLEGEVLEEIEQLGENQGRLAMEGETVGPRQFWGLELNPRAVPIADLVLWIGYLKWQLRTMGLNGVGVPVLEAYGTIQEGDAILSYKRKEMRRDAIGRPETVWDGQTVKPDPISGVLVPDETAQIPTYDYFDVASAKWPDAEFIVGNPPFIGNKRLRDRLGWGYVNALFIAYPDVEHSADFVMYWWKKAALELKRYTRRFGFVTTNSIRQSFNRRVVDDVMRAKSPPSILFAIPDHPWVASEDAAATRIAMTVVGHSDDGLGTIASVVSESMSDQIFDVQFSVRDGVVSSALALGAAVSDAISLGSNRMICGQGVKIVGAGFLIDESRSLSKEWEVGRIVRRIMGARELAERGDIQRRVVDFSGLSLEQAREAHPAAYQKVLTEVKPERDQNKRKSIRELWWRFAWERPLLRRAVSSIEKYIATPETSKHRIFSFIDSDVVFDGTLFAIASNRGYILSSLQARVNASWTLRLGNLLGPTPRFNNSNCFDPFPFPAFSDLPPALLARLDTLGERLDAFRKARLAEHEVLTMTGMYNVLERLRELEAGADVPPLDAKERAIHEAGLISVLKEIHDDIDRAVFEAYGWSDLAPALVGKPGATTPSPHKGVEQEAAEEELLTRLVALNRERAAEEARGLVRWLRPDYQIPKLGQKIAAPAEEQIEAELPVAAVAGPQAPAWPANAFEQIRLVRDILVRAPAPAPVDAIAAAFGGRVTAKRKARVEEVLETLVVTGGARMGAGAGAPVYFVPR